MSVPNEICKLSTLRACESLASMCGNVLTTASVIIPDDASFYFAGVIGYLEHCRSFLERSVDDLRVALDGKKGSVPFCIKFDDDGTIIPVTDNSEIDCIIRDNQESLSEAESYELVLP